MNSFLFTSKRLGFRNWTISDTEAMIPISANKEVMQYFPKLATEQETRSFTRRMQDLFEQKKYCYFACIELKSNQFIGFIGLSEPNFTADFTPCVDIGWRLAPQYWGFGYATEGAKRCTEYGFNTIGLKKIISIAPRINEASIGVMRKIGMREKFEFNHPKLSNYPHLKCCVCYEVEASDLG